jgi:hypothetical protein
MAHAGLPEADLRNSERTHCWLLRKKVPGSRSDQAVLIQARSQANRPSGVRWMGWDGHCIVSAGSAVQSWSNQLKPKCVGSDHADSIRSGSKMLHEGAAEAGRGDAKHRLVTRTSPRFELTDSCRFRATDPNHRCGNSRPDSDRGSGSCQSARNSTAESRSIGSRGIPEHSHAAIDWPESSGKGVSARVLCSRVHPAVPASARRRFSIKPRLPTLLPGMPSRAAFVVLTALLLAAPASAWRSPSPAEHQAIVAAIRKNPAAFGVRTVQRVRVSTVDRRFATAVTYPRDKEGRVLSRDAWLLGHGVHGWRIIFVGSDMPPCNVASAPVRRELLGSTACFSP